MLIRLLVQTRNRNQLLAEAAAREQSQRDAIAVLMVSLQLASKQIASTFDRVALRNDFSRTEHLEVDSRHSAAIEAVALANVSYFYVILARMRWIFVSLFALVFRLKSIAQTYLMRLQRSKLSNQLLLRTRNVQKGS